ncbi:hypothetical protein L3Q82_025229 [Scortum barcoo]|uniref:Uncharacterized protein n=1 Tax=Scortum barcoo TaxID=214431 RepID=A0ACB8WSP4_9TELE|nr:hypothetical protein L3Q82_025229 [Scortum barcoo]
MYSFGPSWCAMFCIPEQAENPVKMNKFVSRNAGDSGYAPAPTNADVNRMDSRCSGRVEVLLNNQWGTVCDNGWGLNDAMVVCRQLGCGKALKATKRASFGQGSGPIWMDNVQCTGHESSVTDCKHQGLGLHKCGHEDDVGVVCEESGHNSFCNHTCSNNTTFRERNGHNTSYNHYCSNTSKSSNKTGWFEQ